MLNLPQLATNLLVFMGATHNTNHNPQQSSHFGVSAFVNSPSIYPRVRNNHYFSNHSPIATQQRLTEIKASPDKSHELLSDHPAFQACERGSVIARMKDPDRTQLTHLNSLATKGIDKIQKGITALKNGNPNMIQRAELLFGKQVEVSTLIDGLKTIKTGLEQVKKEGAYRIDVDIDACPTEAFTILQEVPGEEVPFKIYLRGFFFEPPDIVDMIFKSKEDFQIHALIHESMHLATQDPDVNLSNGMPAYGLGLCVKLAQEDPGKSLTNADSWAWLVS